MLLILRHGETTWNREGRMQGGLDSPLTERGRQQALRQGAILRGIADRPVSLPVFCSPQGRTIRTAELAVPDQAPRIDPRLAELSMGAWQGLELDRIRPMLPPGAMEAHPFRWKFDAPGGESFEAFRNRVAEALATIPRPAIIVTHGVTSQVLRGLWLGMDLDEMATLEDRQGVVYRLGATGQDVLDRVPG